MGGGEKGQKKGHTSGVTSEDITKARDVGDVKPGKTNLVQTTEVGDQWIDHGAVCDGKDNQTPGCFLENTQRMRLVIDFKDRVETASTNYKIALVELKLAELLKKDDDVSWVLSLALDLVGAHLIKVAAKAAIALKASGINKLASAMEGSYLSDQSWRTRTEMIIQSIDDKAIESNVKTLFDPAKKAGIVAVKSAAKGDAKTKKAATLAFIDQLKDQCDLGFQTFATNATGSSSDAELVVLWEGLDRAHHTVGAYKEALGEKLARFKKSGITELGRQNVKDRQFNRADVQRDKRVVWIQENGKKTLHYQSQEGDYNPNVIKRGDPGSEELFGEAGKLKFGARDPREDIRTEGPVPDEFVEVALERSEQLWGITPLILKPSSDAPSYNPFVPRTHRQEPEPPRNPFVPRTDRTNHPAPEPEPPRNPFVPRTGQPEPEPPRNPFVPRADQRANQSPSEPTVPSVPAVPTGAPPPKKAGDIEPNIEPDIDTLPDAFRQVKVTSDSSTD